MRLRALCKEFPSAEDMLARSAAVFAGRVVNMSDPGGSFDPAVGSGYRVVKFRVSRVWKGEPFSTIFLVDAGGSCTANFRVGGEYLVYAYRITEDDAGSSTLTGSLATGACSRPWRLQNAQADIDVLGEGRLPEAGMVTPVPGEATSPDPPAPGEGDIARPFCAGGGDIARSPCRALGDGPGGRGDRSGCNGASVRTPNAFARCVEESRASRRRT